VLNETEAILKQLQEGQAQMARHLPGMLENFQTLAQSIMKQETLAPKFKELIAVAIAVAIRCQPCIAHHVKRALEQGATTAEILEACSIAVMMGGGPSIAYSSCYVIKTLKDLGALEQKEVRCDKCQTDVPEIEIHEHRGRKLCEDCYVAALTRPQPCDPGAVSAARTSRELQGFKGAQGLTPLQKKIYDYLKEKGKATRPELAAYVGIPLEDLEKEFAVLRHCELARGFKEGNTVYLTLM